MDTDQAQRTFTYGEAIEQTRTKVLATWIDLTGHGRDAEEMLSVHRVQEEVNALYYPTRGLVDIVVTVTGRSVTPDHTGWCRFRKTGPNEWVVDKPQPFKG